MKAINIVVSIAMVVMVVINLYRHQMADATYFLLVFHMLNGGSK
jgi:hypothetical protein